MKIEGDSSGYEIFNNWYDNKNYIFMQETIKKNYINNLI